MKAVHTIDHVVNTILRWIVMIMLSVMSVIVFAQVVFRIVHLSIPWSEELSKYLLIWSTFMGAALCILSHSVSTYSHNHHILLHLNDHLIAQHLFSHAYLLSNI